MLHTINKSPFEKDSLKTCLRYAEKGSSVLFIEDAVYACTKGTNFEKQIADHQENINFYVLGPDLDARGLDNSNLTNNIEIIDYKGFVKLVADNEKTLNDWEKDVATVMAKEDDIDLSEDHWEIINFLREYYEEYQIAPAVRVLTKAVGKKLGKDKGNSKYLYELFPYGPGKQACKFAGLPKPTGCV